MWLAGPARSRLPPGNYVTVRVRDQGPGMTRAGFPGLFVSGSSKGKGRGLGLKSVLALSQGMRGGNPVRHRPVGAAARGRATLHQAICPTPPGYFISSICRARLMERFN